MVVACSPLLQRSYALKTPFVLSFAVRSFHSQSRTFPTSLRFEVAYGKVHLWYAPLRVQYQHESSIGNLTYCWKMHLQIFLVTRWRLNWEVPDFRCHRIEMLQFWSMSCGQSSKSWNMIDIRVSLGFWNVTFSDSRVCHYSTPVTTCRRPTFTLASISVTISTYSWFVLNKSDKITSIDVNC